MWNSWETNDYDKYKEDNSQHQDSNKSVINTTKEEQALIKGFMSMDFKHHIILYVKDIVTFCGKKWLNWNNKRRKKQGKDKWERLAVIPLIPLLGVNHRQPILHISKRLVHYYSTDETIN